MENHEKIGREIDNLRSMLPSGLFSSSKPNWKSIWVQIKKISEGFKNVRFPTKEERETAWNEFQSLVDDVKQQQEKEHEEWNKKKSESERLRDRIIRQADNAKISSGLADIILTLATGGINLILDAIMGPFDEKKSELQNASKQLQKGWEMLKEYKNDMLGRDKQEAFEALNNAKENLDAEWEEYKRERQKAFDNFIREKERNRDSWRERVENNIRKLEDRRDRLNDVLSHKESHLDDLRDKLSDARSDDYRDRISGWISEEESNIDDIRDKLKNIEDWLYEERSKLN